VTQCRTPYIESRHQAILRNIIANLLGNVRSSTLKKAPCLDYPLGSATRYGANFLLFDDCEYRKMYWERRRSVAIDSSTHGISGGISIANDHEVDV